MKQRSSGRSRQPPRQAESIQPVLDAIARTAARLCEAHDAMILQVEGDTMRHVAKYGRLRAMRGIGETFPLSRDWVGGRAVIDGKTVHIRDLTRAAGFAKSRAFARLTRARTFLATPLLQNGTAVGAILIRRTRVRPFTAKQIALLKTFAAQAAIAIENARLSRELEARNADLIDALEQQTATGEILHVISRSPTDVQPTFEAIAASAARLCDAGEGTVFRFDGVLIHVAAHHGRAQSDLVRSVFPRPPGRGSVTARAILTGAVVHLPDAAADPELESSPLLTRGFRTVLSVPMLRDGAPSGAITVTRRKVDPFTNQQVALLQTFADQAVIAIENARLFKELQEKNRALTESNAQVTEALDRQTATADVLRIIAHSPTELQPVLDAIAASALRLCAASDAVIERLDDDRFYNAAHAGTQMKGLVGLPLPLTRGFPGGRAVLDRQRVIIDDMQAVAESEYPDTLELLKLNTVHSCAEIPLLSEGKSLGNLAVLRAEVRPFTDAEIALLETFADQAVIAIENVRLFKELEARNRALTEALEQQTATSEILRVISSSPTDLQPVFDSIAASATRLCEALFGLVFRFDGEMITLVAHASATPEQLSAIRTVYPMPPGGQSVAARAIHERRVIAIADSQTSTEYPHIAERARAIGYRSLVSVPMLRGGVAIGAINVVRAEATPFTDTQIELLETFADQAVIAIENVRLFTELEARNRDLTTALEQQTATSEILRVISSSPTDVQPVFDTIAGNALRLCEASSCGVFRFDGEIIHAVAVAPGGGDAVDYWRRQYPRPIGDGRGPVAHVLRTRAVLNIPNVMEHPVAVPRTHEFARRFGYRSQLVVPMLREGAPIGVISVFRPDLGPFTNTQVELLQTFADQAVIAIENVRLFKELEERNRELTEALEQQTATSEILRIISSSPTDVQPVFDTIVASAVRLCRAHIGAVYQFDGEMLHLVAHYNFTSEQLHAVRSLHPRRPQRDLVSGRAILTRAVAQIEDILADPAYHRDFALATGWRSMVGVPMLREGESIGAIVINRSEAGAFADNHIDLLKTFADQAVIAIENVRLFNELQARTTQLTRSVDELTALGEVSRALSSTLDLETVLNTIVARANQLAGTDGCSVWEYDETAEAFHLRVTDNIDQAVVTVMRRTTVLKGEGAVGQMAMTRAPVHIPDIATENAYRGSMRDVLLRTGTRALLAVPLLRDDRLVGGLTVNRKTPGEFPPETVELLKTFATQSALAINNARLFREIEDKGRQLEIASQHKSQFLANMSHELRTPLNAILGYTELIADNIYGEVPERMREVLERVDKSGRHLLGLINDILDLSKIEAGQLTLALGPYAMDSVAQTVATQVGALAAEKQLGFETALADDLPIGQGDERRLTQVLLNLVGNAIKFTDVGKVVVRVGMSGDEYVVSVTDTGPGIAKADREKIFEEFQQADTTRAKAKGGTGLGLAISRRIVEMHGGRLWVDSTLGEGSTFSFTVPVHVEHQVAVPRQGAP